MLPNIPKRKQHVKNWKIFIEWMQDGIEYSKKKGHWEDYRYYVKQKAWFTKLVNKYDW